MSDRTAYLRAAAQLRSNSGQWAAYDSRGHCVVLAGPGSGKTKTLTTKIARLLSEDVHEPRGLACITYNNECARELEDRLAALGVTPGGRVFIGTVHSFSLTQIIVPYAKVAGMGLPDNFGVATQVDRLAALAEAVESIVGRGNNPRSWELRLGRYRRTYLNRDSNEWRDTNPQLARLVVAYEGGLRRRGLIDFDDMPLLAVRALRAHPWMQRALYAKYPVLVVDEYQDLGTALHRMVLGLCFSTGMRLFAVGDVDQSIYGYIGARPDLLQRLSEREDVETVHLRLNYRSGNQIVTASEVALGEARDYESANSATQGAVFIHSLAGTYERHAERLIADLLPQALARHPGLDNRDVAILYPAAWLGDPVAGAALAAGITFIRTDGNALYPRSSKLMRWLEICGQWCCGGWRTGTPLFRQVLSEGLRLFADALHKNDRKVDFDRRLIALLWQGRDGNENLYEWIGRLNAQLIKPFGDDCAELREERETLAAFVERVGPTGDRESMVLGELAGDGRYIDRLTLSTLHSAKGREFSIVFMFGMDLGNLPRNNSSQDEISEARRLFYVGFTRSKAEVHLVHTNGRSSPFVDEIEQHLATR